MKNKLNLSLDLRIVCMLLVVIILAMTAMWRPWQNSGVSDRTISVTGTGKITAQPDTYQFNPSYQKPTTGELITVITTVTNKLKELGVAEKDIQLQSNAYTDPQPLGDKVMTAPAPEQVGSTAYLTIKVPNKELAQKVQDYITTTGAEGQLTPQPTFSDEKQKELKDQARAKAIDDAKAQASKTANNLGAKLGRVVEVKDSTEFGGIYSLEAGSSRGTAQDTVTTLPIFPGEQNITFAVQVTFEIK